MKRKIKSDDGSVYEGETLNGKPHGKGKKTFRNNWYEDGEWKNGEFLRGKVNYYDWNKESYYEGDWADGKPNGKGNLYYVTCRLMYEGDWVDGKYHGKGKLDDEYTVYEGDFVDGYFHGKGRYAYVPGDGRVYEGDFAYDEFHGKGKMTYKDGRVEEGNWEKGKFTGK